MVTLESVGSGLGLVVVIVNYGHVMLGGNPCRIYLQA